MSRRTGNNYSGPRWPFAEKKDRADPPAPRRCACGHTHAQHEIRSGGLFGCYIAGCICIDFEPAP